jgi:predicted RNase H-like HicB family nuclease
VQVRHYTAIIESGETPGYGVFFPDLPGCVSAGDSVQEAALNAEEALSLHVELMLESGEELPDPTPPDQIEADPEVSEVARMLIRVELPRTEKRRH